MKPSEKSFALEFYALIAAAIFTAVAAGCGSNSPDEDVTLNASEGSPVNVIPINLLDGSLPTDGSIVKVVVKFKDGTDVRLSSFNQGEDMPFTSPLGKAITNGVNALVTSYDSRVTNIGRVMQASELDVDAWRASWARQGVTLNDWNTYYYLDLPDADSAKELAEDLKGDESIDYAEVIPEFYLTEVTSPDMSADQWHLNSATDPDFPGLGIEEAWELIDQRFPGKNIRGQDVTVTDQEYDWNFDHEMLPIDETGEYISWPGINDWNNVWNTSAGKDVPANINHGTAVVGIVAGQGDDLHGIKGISPMASVMLASALGGGGFGSSFFADLRGAPGSILLIETQQKGVTTVSSGCSVGDGTSSPTVTGCVPLEAGQYLHDAISDTTSTGTTVIEAAGNGSVDLNNDALVAPLTGTFSNFNKPGNDSGAVMVGATVNPQRYKASWTNCGTRVDVFAPGLGVVTAGYGDKYNPDGADAYTLEGANNPKLYTGQFGGTSAATAEIAGIAALIQSYARATVNEAGFVGRTVYLDPLQIRDILRESGNGQAAVYGETPGDPNPNGCNIGVQPNAALAIQLTEEYLSDPETVLKIVPTNQYVVSGIRYDMDDDKKAELISFSRDHKWYIDLSSNGFGEWDLVLDVSNSLILSPSKDAMLFPVVADYNSDGRADLALYDSVNGKWYIKYTASHVIASPQGAAISWDKIIDYSTDPNWKAYSRPLVADFNNDKWIDITILTPDGTWLMDFGGFNGVRLSGSNLEYLDKYGSFDKTGISALPTPAGDQPPLSLAPGWAWLPVIGEHNGGSTGGIYKKLLMKIPDGVTFSKTFLSTKLDDDGSIKASSISKTIVDGTGNDSYFTMAGYAGNNKITSFGFKHPNGGWVYLNFTSSWSDPMVVDTLDYGDVLCRPVPADYDGDGMDDRAVQCGNEWRIAYSSNSNALSVFVLPSIIDPLPGIVYAGGISYQDVYDIFNYHKTELKCGDAQCTDTSTIYDVNPPIGPYFSECVNYWAPNAAYCWDK